MIDKKKNSKGGNLMTIYYLPPQFLKNEKKRKRELYGEKEIEQDGVP